HQLIDSDISIANWVPCLTSQSLNHLIIPPDQENDGISQGISLLRARNGRFDTRVAIPTVHTTATCHARDRSPTITNSPRCFGAADDRPFPPLFVSSRPYLRRRADPTSI